MKSAIALCVLAGAVTAFAQDSLPAAREGSIRGKVTAADTGQPIATAEVRITGGTYTSLNPRWVYADADGKYEVSGLPTGRYTVSASRVGYLRLDYGQQRPAEKGIEVVVSGARATDQIDVALPRGAVIVARVIDEFGEPASGYSVCTFRRDSGTGGRLAPVGELDVLRATDDRGEMRLWGLAPGEYYIGVAPNFSSSVMNPSRRTQAQTFYPGTTEAGAQPVTVGLGAELFIEVPLVRTRAARINGVIVGQTSFSSPPTVSLTRRLVGSSDGHPITVRPDGSFSATDLRPAEYDISARFGNEAGTLRVQVSGEDIDGLVLTMRPAVALRGRLTFEPRAPVRSRWPSTVSLRPVFTEGRSLVSSTVINPDWTFEIRGVTGSGVFRFPELPSGWYLKAVVIEGKDVTDVPVDFSSLDGRPIDVQLTQRLAQISGSALDSNNRATVGYSVVVFPDDASMWTSYSRSIAAVRPDQSGRFLVTGLPAGRYLVRAIEYLQPGTERNPDTLDRLRIGATPVTLEDRQSVDLRLRLTP